MSAASPSPIERSDPPWLLVAILTAIYIFAFLDRTVITLLVDPIKHDLALSDVQVSLLMGLAFSIAYSLTNIPAGILIDRLGRRGMLAGSILFWSTMTTLSGLSMNYRQILLAGIGMGAAEAFVTPAAVSLVRDRIDALRHGRAFAILGMAPFIGSAGAYIGGGAILDAAASGGLRDWPLVSGLAPWQSVMVLAGMASLIPLPLLLLLSPDRRDGRIGQGGSDSRSGIKAQRADVQTNVRAYAVLVGFGICYSLFSFGVGNWVPTMMSRSYDLPLAKVGYVYGYVTLVSGIAGLLVSGGVIDRLNARGGDIIPLAAVSLAIAGMGGALIPLMPTPIGSWVMSVVMGFCAAPLFAVGFTLLARITPREQMGRATAVYLLGQSVIGAGLGPTVVAAIANALFHGKHAIGLAMSLFAVVTIIVATGLLLSLRRLLRLPTFLG